MKKNLFLITEDEKQRILGMHETATKRVYLSEQTPEPSVNPRIDGLDQGLNEENVPPQQ